jgi:hypothetical protein
MRWLAMMSKKYQLSKKGIERLEQFKRDVVNGDCQIFPEKCRGKIVYFKVHSDSGLTCVFNLNESKVKENAIKMIDKTLTGEVERRIMTHDGSKYFCVDDGCALLDSDVEEVSNA